MNKLNLSPSVSNKKSRSDMLKVIATTALLSVMSPTNAQENSTNFDVYWVGVKSTDNSYTWAWVSLESNHFKWQVEASKDYRFVWAFWIINLTDHTYSKFGASHLQYDDYKVWKYSINPKQTTWGLAFWAGNDDYIFEMWYAANQLSWAENANTRTHTAYIDSSRRRKFENWQQFDFTTAAKVRRAYWETKYSGNFQWAYYPTEDIKIIAWADTASRNSSDYKVGLWIRYNFDNKWFHPYFQATSNIWSHSYAWVEYSEQVANRSLNHSNSFESEVFTKSIVAQQVNPEEFQKRVESSFKQAPENLQMLWKQTVNLWDTVNYKAQAQDANWNPLTYVWTLNGTQVWTWESVDIHFDKLWNSELKLTVKNTQWLSSEKKMTIEVKEVIPEVSTIELKNPKTKDGMSKLISKPSYYDKANKVFNVYPTANIYSMDDAHAYLEFDMIIDWNKWKETVHFSSPSWYPRTESTQTLTSEVKTQKYWTVTVKLDHPKSF